METSTALMVATSLSGLTLLLLAVLTAVWVRNYRTFESRLTLGLVAFSTVLLVENAVAIYFFFSTAMLYSSDPTVQLSIIALRSLQLVAVTLLTAVTMT